MRPASRLSRPPLALAALLLAGACSDTFDPAANQVGGDWLYAAPALNGPGWSCSVAGLDLSLSQTGRTFNGTTGPAELDCVSLDDDGSTSRLIGPLPVVRGLVNGDDVSFQLGSDAWPHEGVLSGVSISGTTSLTLPLGGEAVTLTGSFGAARRPGDDGDGSL